MENAFELSKIDLKGRHSIWSQLIITRSRKIDVNQYLRSSKLNSVFRSESILDQYKLDHDVILVNCIVINSIINASTLNNCLAINCRIQDSTIKNSQIEDSNVKDCRIIHTLVDRCTVSPAASNLLKQFPPEIREQIFGDAIEWHGKTPPLIAALRGDPTLYHEALAVLYKEHPFKIHKLNEESRWSAYLSTFRNIRSLEFDDPKSFFPATHFSFPEQLCASPMIRDIHINFTVGFNDYAFVRNFSEMISVLMRRLGSIENLSVSFDPGDLLWEDFLPLDKGIARRFIARKVIHGNTCFATQAIKDGDLWGEPSFGRRGYRHSETYTWKAKYGESLKWTER